VCSDTISKVCAPVNWTKGSKLGAGGFGQVFLCHDRDSGRVLAVKEISVACQPDEATEVLPSSSLLNRFHSNFHLKYSEYLEQLDPWHSGNNIP